ncbi:SDH family Clp fold serine proteinase [Ignicoccus hospitalis]|uniref:Periplasmic serine protease n=1 Tax=Ignicoccus hospitalis (strain KIN4/I / DSM 18386 / JCM 14125) TaxID=453591 RepID=A8A9W3_IGNH4|nr:ATP-dependent Clp protease proteolytic subunit [Ignicoccus hospitalis]ABU81715.1 protein of unknown function DUF114 [Ignicoccus hospitalis KIN4/I]HIH89978.1 hypothetical protein [Desulfurococcaceae archaeon]
MDIIGLLFWLLLLTMITEPVLEYQRIKNARMNVLRRIEEKYGYRIITLIHRQERVGFFGIPFYRFIDVEDSEAVIRAIHNTPKDVPIMMILHTPGGMVLAASQIAKALHDHPAKKVAVVPHYAMSGGTLIALAADEIWMGPAAALGPLDPQVPVATPAGPMHVPSPSVVKVAEEKGKEANEYFLVHADVAKKALNEMLEFVTYILKDKVGEEKAREIAEELVTGKYTHDHPLFYEDLVKLGLPVKKEVPEEVWALMELYPQAQPQRPGVEYLPVPAVPQKRGLGDKA